MDQYWHFHGRLGLRDDSYNLWLCENKIYIQDVLFSGIPTYGGVSPLGPLLVMIGSRMNC